jgi:Kyakuja-Dileera-Zisupton transposase
MKEHVQEEQLPTKPAFSSPLNEEHEEANEVDVADYGDWVDEPAAKEDFVEHGMKVPVSALDACHESFTAADEARQKASTTIFADTGLMALLCEHD